MSGIERENLLKLYMLLVDYTKEAIIDFFKLHLTNKSLNFENFINLNQHEIYHLCYNTRTCCRPGCNVSYRTPYVPKRILNPVQIDKLLDNTSTRQSYHRPTSTGDYCCCLAKPGIKTNVLDVTLANCLLINFCQDLFWKCCLTQGQNLTSFLDCNKHRIFHLANGSQSCCMCSGTSCPYVTQQSVKNYYWHLLFNKPSGNACITSGTQCICSLSATVGLTPTNMDDACTRALHKQFCPARKALDALVNYRNIYGHPDTTFVPVVEYERVKNDIGNSILILAALSGQDVQTRQKLSDLENVSLDVQLCEQYRNTLLEHINRDRKLEEAITDLPGIMKSIVDERLNQIEEKLDNLADIDFDSKRQSTIGEILRLHDNTPLANNLNDSSGSLDCSAKSRFQTGLKTAIQLLSSVKFLDPKLCAVITTVESLFKIFSDTTVEDELHRFIEDKIYEEIFCECEGTIQYYVSSIIFLSGIGIESLEDSELKFVYDNIKPFHGVFFMGKLWNQIDILKKSSAKRRNFTKLMNYIQAYMYLSFMRDLTSVLFCQILEVCSSKKILRGMDMMMEHHKSRDKELLQFLVKPTKNTLIFNFMYKSNNWPAIDNMLTNYFFPNQKTQNPLNYLCDGEFVIKPIKYSNACLYMANIGGWLRWSNVEKNEQSRFKFIQHEIDGKIYYQIFSVKWNENYATMGLASWWARGWTGTPDDHGLWEIISFESKDFGGEELYMFSPKDSRANFVIVDACRRVYGSRCLPSVYTFFRIESRFVDALEVIDSDTSETTEEYEECIDASTSIP